MDAHMCKRERERKRLNMCKGYVTYDQVFSLCPSMDYIGCRNGDLVVYEFEKMLSNR